MNDTPHEIGAGLEVLLEVARTHSGTQAARALGTTTATVLRRLGALEDALGARLFDRTPGGLLPTPALERVLPWAEQAAGALGHMKDELAGLEREARGVVRVATLPGVSRLLLAPALGALFERHPALVVELLPASAIVDLARREADLALRTVRPTAGDLVTQRLVGFRLAVMASPSLWDGPRRPPLSALPWLSFTESLAATPESTWLGAHVPNARVVLRSTDLDTLLHAAQAGLGAIVVAEPLGRLAGGLVELRAPAPLPEGALWLVAHRALRSVPRVAVVWDWIAETIAAQAEARGAPSRALSGARRPAEGSETTRGRALARGASNR